MITPANALGLIYENVRPLKPRREHLEQALGCNLAEDVRADRDIPPAVRSAMDGYAVRSSDLVRGARVLRSRGEVAAGSPARCRVMPGTCVRILTGANVPRGADTVVMVEQTKEKDGLVTVTAPVEAGANILRRGEDAKKGSILLRKGTLLGPLQVGVCAAVGKPDVRVHGRPGVGLLCTGEELRSISAKVQPHEQRDSNGPALRAALSQWGYRNVPYRSVPDDVKAIRSAINRLRARCEVTLLTGGVSVGKYDFVREAVERAGGTVIFHGVAMKPGKPLLYAALGENRHVFGLPGPPLSAMTTFYEFVLPALRRMSGLEIAKCRPLTRVPLASRITSKGGRVRFVLARLIWEESGVVAEPVESHSSADLVAGGMADGVIAVPASVTRIDKGDLAEFRPWRPLP